MEIGLSTKKPKSQNVTVFRIASAIFTEGVSESKLRKYHSKFAKPTQSPNKFWKPKTKELIFKYSQNTKKCNTGIASIVTKNKFFCFFR